MKITKTQLRKIIKEELSKEESGDDLGKTMPFYAKTRKFIREYLKGAIARHLDELIAALETSRFDLTDDLLEIAKAELATRTEHSGPDNKE